MIKRNKKIIKALFISICIIVLSMNAFASNDEWLTVYTEDYSSSDEVITDGITKEGTSFSAEIKDEQLVVKSDALCYYRVQDAEIENLNSDANSHGMSVQIYNNSWVCTKIEDSGDGVVYTAKNTNGILVEEQGGLNSLGTVRIKTSTKTDRNNIMFNVDPSLFKSTDNSFIMKIKYYTPDGLDKLQLSYRDSRYDSKDKTVTVYDVGESDEVNQWNTKTINITDADFTKPVTTAVYNFRFTGIGNGAVYIHSIELYKAEDTVSDDAENSVLEQKISETPIYGNSKLEYDMILPSGVRCADDCVADENCITAEYNEGKNVMSVSMADSNNVEFSALLYELEGSNVNLYAKSSDEDGMNNNVLIYQGDIADRILSYSMELDMKEGTYLVEIYEDGEELTLIENGPFAVCNKEELELYCKTQYIKINHSNSSEALYSVFDNIKVSSQVNVDYESAAKDLDAINIPAEVREDFDLPVTGSINLSDISWESNDPAIEISGSLAIVTRSENEAIVTLKAIADCNGMVAEKEFEVVVKSLEGIYAAVADCNGYFESDGTITADATLVHPGTSGASSVTFAVLSIDSATGKICNSQYITYDITNIYGEMYLGPIRGMDAKGGNTVKCYLWDNNNKSFANNIPVVRNFKAESKVKGVGLSWEGYDDNTAIEFYEVYRNGEKIAEVSAEESNVSFLDKSATGSNNSYSVIPVDTNTNKGEEVADESKHGKIKMEYYLVPYGEGEAEINANGNGISMLLKTSETSAGYTKYNEKGRIIPSGKYIPLLVSDTMPKNNIAIEFTYKANANTKLQVLYNTNQGISEFAGDSHTVTESESGKWQIFTARLTDANLEIVTGKMNHAHFALQALGGEVLLNKIEIIELSKYE